MKTYQTTHATTIIPTRAPKLNLRYDDEPIELSEQIKKAVARLEHKAR